MGEDLASANVNRSYTLAASSIAIFTFTLFFLYPRYVSGEANPILFKATIIVMGLATFSFVFASFYYYLCSLAGRVDDEERLRFSRRADRFWLFGCTMMFLAPNLILFSLALIEVASVWLALWLIYLSFFLRHFPKVQT